MRDRANKKAPAQKRIVPDGGFGNFSPKARRSMKTTKYHLLNSGLKPSLYCIVIISLSVSSPVSSVRPSQ